MMCDFRTELDYDFSYLQCQFWVNFFLCSRCADVFLDVVLNFQCKVASGKHALVVLMPPSPFLPIQTRSFQKKIDKSDNTVHLPPPESMRTTPPLPKRPLYCTEVGESDALTTCFAELTVFVSNNGKQIAR